MVLSGRFIRRVAAGSVLALAALTGVQAQTAPPAGPTPTFKAGSIAVVTPWTRATPGGAKVAGGYMLVTNAGSEPDRLISLSADWAGKSELHEMAVTNGVMTMRPLEKIDLAPGKSIEFKPNSYHVMFMDLKQPLKAGDQMKATLRFEKAGPLEVTFSVGTIGASSAPTGHAGH
jgi:periplasmic copper chaperone A